MGYLCANFSLPMPLCSRLRPDVRDRQTSDVRQRDVRHASSLNAPTLEAGHNNSGRTKSLSRFLADRPRFNSVRLSAEHSTTAGKNQHINLCRISSKMSLHGRIASNRTQADNANHVLSHFRSLSFYRFIKSK